MSRTWRGPSPSGCDRSGGGHGESWTRGTALLVGTALLTAAAGFTGVSGPPGSPGGGPTDRCSVVQRHWTGR